MNYPARSFAYSIEHTDIKKLRWFCFAFKMWAFLCRVLVWLSRHVCCGFSRIFWKINTVRCVVDSPEFSGELILFTVLWMLQNFLQSIINTRHGLFSESLSMSAISILSDGLIN